MDVPRVSLAAIQDEATRAIRVSERQTPVPKSTQVLVKISCSGVCAADLHFARRDLPYLQPKVSITGHEGVGVIVALGQDANTDVWGIGDRVGIRWLHRVCKQCEPCTTGFENLCPNRLITGKDVEGAFAQFALAESEYLVRLPESVADAEAAPILCAGVTVYKALKVTALKRGSFVAVSGAGGGLGHLAIQYARAMGLRVLAVDAQKREFCLKLGAEAYVDVKESTDLVAEVIKITEGGAHGVLVCASSGQAYADAVKYLRRAGTMVCIGAPSKPSPIPVLPDDFIARGIRIVGTSTGSLQDTEEALSFLTRGEINPQVSERHLEDVEAALNQIEAGNVEGRLVIRI